MQAYSLLKAWEFRDEHFDQRVRVALHQVAARLIELNEGTIPAKSLVHRKTSNYFLVNIDDIIDANALEYFLHDELSNVSLNLDFEYAVFDCFSNQMVYGKYCKVEEDDSHIKTRDLPTYDEFVYYFGVRFPTKTSFIFSGMTRYMIGASILLFTLGFFVYATYVLLTQKKITEMQRDFINNMTHEFKTPLSSIKISSEVLANSPMIKENERLSQYVNIIQSQESRLNNQIERVLKIASLEGDSLCLAKENVHLNALVEDLALARKAEIEKTGGKLNIQQNGDIMLDADPVHTANILHSLLDNAIKYSHDNIDIRVETGLDGEIPYFKITDSGIGMSAEQLDNIGQKFYRVSKGDIHDVKGFGLGLYYVKTICKLQHWKINIKSQLKQGTTVKILFYN